MMTLKENKLSNLLAYNDKSINWILFSESLSEYEKRKYIWSVVENILNKKSGISFIYWNPWYK